MKLILVKILFLLFLLIGTFIGVYSAVFLLFGSGGDTNIASIGEGDTYTLDDSVAGVKINLTSQYTPGYQNGKRFDISQIDQSGLGFIESEQYGSFYIDSGKEIELYIKTGLEVNCDNEKIAYAFSGSVRSELWGDVPIISGSYYCPISKKFKLPLSGLSIGDITLTGAGGGSFTHNVKNTQGTDTIVNDYEIFDNKKISITGLISNENVDGTDSELIDMENTFTQVEYGVSGKMTNFNLFINKNIKKLTKEVIALTDNPLLGFEVGKELFYYDYSGEVETTPSNENNYGKILKIGNGGARDDNFNQMGVTGLQTLIVKGGNVYIDADIYNRSEDSLLVIVVKRDETNSKNGGNIYIDPYVTNIDAVLIAEGSIISYNGLRVLSTKSYPEFLTKQLLIYGSLSTKNTIGDNKSPYGSDRYIKDGEGFTDSLYNLENLRSFEVMRSNDGSRGDTCYDYYDYVDDNITSKTGKDFEFAGKKKCYITEDVSNNLRSTEKTSPLVIEYNPRINLNPPKILQQN